MFRAIILPVSGALYFVTSCNTQPSSHEDGQNNCPNYVELTRIISMMSFLHLVALYILFIFHYIFVRFAKQSQFVPLQIFVYFIKLFLIRKIFTYYINEVLISK